ncbi:MAG: hypothetical protein KC550_00355 [Nanoarchaeota archaeon]|nr:hypothetical protein [Nanoarchaeota archaeon]
MNAANDWMKKDLAKQYEIPTVFVTSTYHHDIAFEPIRNKFDFPYVDTLVDDNHGGKRKNWKKGIEILLGEKWD